MSEPTKNDVDDNALGNEAAAAASNETNDNSQGDFNGRRRKSDDLVGRLPQTKIRRLETMEVGQQGESGGESDSEFGSDSCESGSEGLSEDVIAALNEVDKVEKEITALEAKMAEGAYQSFQAYAGPKNTLFMKRDELLKKIPGFWRKVLINHPRLLLDDMEADVLHYLTKIIVEDTGTGNRPTGLTIRFYFKENPFFTNQVIEKVYTEKLETKPSQIQWTEDHDEFVSHTRKGSLFRWLSDDKETNEEIREMICDEIWPSPVQYFFNPDDGVSDEEGSSEEEDDDEEDSSDENEIDLVDLGEDEEDSDPEPVK